MGRVTVGFSCQKQFAALVDKRARLLGLDRSEYVHQVLRRDILQGRLDKDFTITAADGLDINAAREATKKRKKRQ